ncbi:MAG: hypothetical protein ABSD52_03055 [Candidatus Cybelea sp.]
MVTALLPVLQPALAGFQYDLAGEDVYRVESTATVSRVSYTGTEGLSIKQDGKAMRFEARAHYVRYSPDGKSSADARFVTELLPNGSFEGRVDDDPDFLTILNQPFAVQLDPVTLRDLRELHGGAPFSASSPLGGDSVLHGSLRPGAGGPIDGRPTVAVRFQAVGPMAGTLPSSSGASISGTMRMDGTAYYALDDAMLLALSARLTIDARLRQNHPALFIPVHITYLRAIRVVRDERDVGQAVKMLKMLR